MFQKGMENIHVTRAEYLRSFCTSYCLLLTLSLCTSYLSLLSTSLKFSCSNTTGLESTAPTILQQDFTSALRDIASLPSEIPHYTHRYFERGCILKTVLWNIGMSGRIEERASTVSKYMESILRQEIDA